MKTEVRQKAKTVKWILQLKEDLDAASITQQTLQIGKLLGKSFRLQSWSAGKAQEARISLVL